MKQLLLCWLAIPCAAIAADYPDLPAAPIAEAAMRSHPTVVAARAGIAAGEAARDQFEAGPHEFNLRVGSARRREAALDRATKETEFGIERTLRLPGKAAKDAEIGAAVIDRAGSLHGDALHEAGRLLLRSWFDWRREQAAVDEWRVQADILRQQSDVAAKRVAAGDAARLEQLLSAAQHVQAEAQAAIAESRLKLAADALRQHFPTLPLPAHVGTATPAPLEQSFEAWREKLLGQSHELRAARASTRIEQLQAQRLDADRVPDPTLGLRWASERDGQERVRGLVLSIPLPGGARAAATRGAQAAASAASAREAQTLAKVEAEARRGVEEMHAAYLNWQRLAEVAQRFEENIRLLEKAWRHGEGQIGDLLNARRQAVEARLAAAQAQLNAAEARYRLLLDVHELWALDDHAD